MGGVPSAGKLTWKRARSSLMRRTMSSYVWVALSTLWAASFSSRSASAIFSSLMPAMPRSLASLFLLASTSDLACRVAVHHKWAPREHGSQLSAVVLQASGNTACRERTKCTACKAEERSAMTILALLTRRTNSFSGASKLAARASACSCNNICSLDANQISWTRRRTWLGWNLGPDDFSTE